MEENESIRTQNKKKKKKRNPVPDIQKPKRKRKLWKNRNWLYFAPIFRICRARCIEIERFECSYILFSEKLKQSIQVQRTRQNLFKNPKCPLEERHSGPIVIITYKKPNSQTKSINNKRYSIL